jgi:hypothetical protein
MDQFAREEIIEKAKIMLGMELEPIDTLLEVYLQNAQEFVIDYCKLTEIPTSFHSVLSQMIVFQYRQKGIENIKSEGKGSLSESYITEYPLNIMNRLNPHCRVKFI